MMRNTFGHIFTLTSFGESHGPAIGGVVDGMPPNIEIDLDFIQNELNRRRPGQNMLTTQRKENDKVEFLSGLFEGKTTGCPIAFIVRNQNQNEDDYLNLKDVFRPSHADFTYYKKYGIRDYKGGGRASARETIARVVAGALAKIALKKINVSIHAFTCKIGDVALEDDYSKYNILNAITNPVKCPDSKMAELMEQRILQARNEGDTIGGIVACVIKGCPPGVGEPVFSKLNAELAAAMLSINAARGFEIGDGFKSASMMGSQHNDPFVTVDGNITTSTNHAGGIQGGITNGNDIFFKVAFKPVPTLMKPQKSVDVKARDVEVLPKGRHDPCVVPRAVPIVEAMAAMTILDNYLLQLVNKSFLQ